MQSNRDRIKEMIEHISTFNDADPGDSAIAKTMLKPENI